MQADKPGLPVLVFFAINQLSVKKKNIVGNDGTVFPQALSVQTENGITVFLFFFFVSSTIPSYPISTIFFCIIITTMEILKGRNTTFTGCAKCSRLRT